MKHPKYFVNLEDLIRNGSLDDYKKGLESGEKIIKEVNPDGDIDVYDYLKYFRYYARLIPITIVEDKFDIFKYFVDNINLYSDEEYPFDGYLLNGIVNHDKSDFLEYLLIKIPKTKLNTNDKLIDRCFKNNSKNIIKILKNFELYKGEEIFYEKVGFYKNKHNENDIYTEFPEVSEIKVNENFIENFKKLMNSITDPVHYFGFSLCRICNNNNGSKEYYYKIKNKAFCWPEGYLHYIQEHNVHPPNEFVEFINDSINLIN